MTPQWPSNREYVLPTISETPFSLSEPTFVRLAQLAIGCPNLLFVANCQILSSWLQPPQVSLVSEMALCLLQKCESPMERGTSRLGENWVYEFLQHHPELSSKYSKQIEHCRALKLRNPLVLIMYFDTVSIK